MSTITPESHPLPLPRLQAARFRATLADRERALLATEGSLERASIAERPIPHPDGGIVWVVEALRVSYRHQFRARLALRRLLAAAGDVGPEPEPEPEIDSGDTTPRAGAPPGAARSVRRHQLALSCRSSTSRGPAHHGPRHHPHQVGAGC